MEFQPKEYFTAYQIGHYMFLIISPIFMILGLIGNTMSFLVYFAKAKSTADKSSHFYLAFLGIADSVSLFASAIPGFVKHAANIDIIYMSGCGWYNFMLYTVTDISIYAVVCITVDRAICVFLPYKARVLCSRQRAMVTMLLVSAILVCINIHLVFTTEQSESIEYTGNVTLSKYFCGDVTEYLTWKRFIWPWVDMTVLLFFPVLALLCLNGGIVAHMQRYYRKVHAEGNIPEHSVAQQRRMNVLVVLICVVFFITTAPITTLHIVESYWDRSDPYQQALHSLVVAFCGHLGYLTNGVNFILYYYRGSNFKQDLKKLFKNRTIVATNTAKNN